LVEVLAGVVVVLLVLVLVTDAPPPEVALVLNPAEPPPVGVVVALEPPLVFELELVLEAGLVFDDEELFVAPVELPESVAGAAALVVGIVSGGAPLVSWLPRPLPPHAASASAASRALPAARTLRRRPL
jgi:hypothetical protein